MAKAKNDAKVVEAATANDGACWLPPDKDYALALLDGKHTIPVKDVGPVAFSEGMRMAAAIYAKRVVEKTDEAN